MNLYEITQAMLKCDWIDEETGEIDEEKKSLFDALDMSFDEKAENLIKYIKNLLSEAKSLKDEENNFKERREKKERKAEALKNYLENMMLLAQKDKLDFVSGEAKFTKSKSVEVDEDFIDWAMHNAKELLSFK